MSEKLRRVVCARVSNSLAAKLDEKLPKEWDLSSKLRYAAELWAGVEPTEKLPGG